MGVFLEDHTLFRVAALPFTTELCRITTMRRSLTTGELEVPDEGSSSARRASRTPSRRAGWVTLVFPQTPRAVEHCACRSARRRPFVDRHCPGCLGVGRGAPRDRAHDARAGEVESLRARCGARRSHADNAPRALDAGIELAERTGRGLIVFLSDEAKEAHLALSRRLHLLGPNRAAIRTVPAPGTGTLLAAVRRAAPAVLIVGASETGFEEPRIGALQRELRCPMLVVRSMPA